MAEKVILLIDDEQGFIEPLVDALAHEGYRVLTAATGAEGLALAAKERIDLAVVDVMMPPGAALENLTSRQKTGVTAVQVNRDRHAGRAISGAFGRTRTGGPDEVAGCCCPDYARASSPWVARSTVGGPSNG